MRYLLAIVLPPMAMFTVGKPFQAILCLLLMVTVIGWPLASIWAVFVVNSAFADTRVRKLLEEDRKTREAIEAQAQEMSKDTTPIVPAP